MAPYQRARPGRLLSCAVPALLLSLALLTPSCAEETTARLRLAWGSDSGAKQQWTGSISIEGARLSDLTPLGIEVDAPVGLQIQGDRLLVTPKSKRGFDGCDLTVQADHEAIVRVELRTDQSPHPTTIEVPLRQIIHKQIRQPLDDPTSFFLAHRAPGDKLKVVLARDHLVFDPEETWTLRLEPDLKEELSREPVQLDIQLRKSGGKSVLWQAGRQITALDTDPIEFEIECPPDEAAYRLTISVRTQEGFTTRFVPGRQATLIASRELEFVVVDPSAKLPVLTDDWRHVLTIDPANPKWWQRLPTWAQASRISGKMAGALGNIRPVVRATENGEVVELPSTAEGKEPYWQSYTLPIRNIGVPHTIELHYPLDQKQHLEISVIEPNAAGLVMKIGGGSGFYHEGKLDPNGEQMGTHRLMFWPHTRSPQLLIVNRHSKSPAQFGKISLLRQDQKAAIDTLDDPTQGRMIAGYISKPAYTESFGAVGMLDAKSGLSVQSWSTFLHATNRLAQYLRYSGKNTLLLSVAADGSALYPSQKLNPSPRYDTGTLASNGQDPLRKDVLEMLLRVFDREGIRLVPTVQFAGPLPAIEKRRFNHNDQQTGIACIGPNGTPWLQVNPDTEGLAPHYNLLNQQVQKELQEVVAEIPRRYGNHPALAGVAVQMAGNGYGMLPGLAWGLDDSTTTQFTQSTGVQLTGQGPQRFRQRAQQLLRAKRQNWTTWRTERITKFYAQLSQQLQAERSDLRLMLTTENLFAGTTLQQQVRQSLASPVKLRQVLLNHGVDLTQLAKVPGLVALPPHRFTASNRLQNRALDLRINTATEQGELFTIDEHTASLFHHSTSHNHLRSFDQQSPFGADQTYLTLSNQPMPTGSRQSQHLIQTLARNDIHTLVEGGEFLSLAHEASTRELHKTWQQLPGPKTPMRTRSKQPIVLRIYRSETATTFAMINESPWPVSVKMPLKTSELCDWHSLSKQLDETSQSGRLDTIAQDWQVELKPYDLQAWRFESTTVRAGELQFSVPDLAIAELKQRIEEIESRTSNLNVERRYPQLQNPGFELAIDATKLNGWQPRVGAAGKVEPETTHPRTGTRAARLRSEDGIGVALQSHLFPMPETGQLTVSAYIKANHMPPEARLYIVLEDSADGQTYRKYATLGGERNLDEQWARYEFAVEDIPLDSEGQMRVMFHLSGNAEVLIDDIEMHDLRFDKSRRGALVKQVYAAKTALDNQQFVDCLRLVDQYWSQYLLEHVPPLESEAIQIAKQPATPETEVPPQEESGIGAKLKGWLPRQWR